MIVVAWAPMALLVWFLNARNNRRQALHSEMLASLGVAPGSGNDHGGGERHRGEPRQKNGGVAFGRRLPRLRLRADPRVRNDIERRARQHVGAPGRLSTEHSTGRYVFEVGNAPDALDSAVQDIVHASK